MEVTTDARYLPENVSAADFASSIAEFCTAVGAENVYTDDELVRPYDDQFPVTDDDEIKGSAVIWPGNAEEVQAIVCIANRYTIPLHAFSAGRNLGYGGSSPQNTGTALLHMGKRMNRVLEINEKLAYAVVEPGVDFAAFHQAVVDSEGKPEDWPGRTGLGQRYGQRHGTRCRVKFSFSIRKPARCCSC